MAPGPARDDGTGPLFQECGCASAAEHILRHMEASAPREQDLDISLNNTEAAPPGKTFEPTGVLSVGAGTTSTVLFIARRGHTGFVKRVSVSDLVGPGDLSLVSVLVEVNGRPLGRIPEQRFARPVILDRDDVLRLTVVNGAAGTKTVAYSIEGWLRANRDRL